MATFLANNFDKAVHSPHSAGEVMVLDDKAALTAALALNDIVKFGYLPAGCIPLDVILVADELDEHATDLLRFSVGILNSDGDDLVAASTFITGAEADADPTVTRAAAAGMKGISPDNDDDLILAAKVTAAAATAAAGNLRAIMTYRASEYGA